MASVRLAASLKERELASFAREHRDALWRERAAECDALMAKIGGLVEQLDQALGEFSAFAAGSDRLCAATGESPRERLPINNVQAVRRDLSELTTGLRPPMPTGHPRALRAA